MIKTIAQLKSGLESSGNKTPQFKAFCRTFKSEFKKTLNSIGCVDLECSNGHFDISGYFNSADGQLWYFILSDVRDLGPYKLLLRTVKDRKSYDGSPTKSAGLEDLADNLNRIIKNNYDRQNFKNVLRHRKMEKSH